MKISRRHYTSRAKRDRYVTKRKAWRRPKLEPLEHRHLLATITVTSLDDSVADDSSITLREAIQAANTNVAIDGSDAGEEAPIVDVIAFAPALSGTIMLTDGELVISESVSIVGPGSGNLTIDAAGNSRAINMLDTAGDVNLSGLRIVGGRTTDDDASGGGIRFDSAGLLSISDSVISINETRGLGATGGGIFASVGDVTVTGSTISSNTTNGDVAHGGGIHVALGALTLTAVTVSSNRTDAAGSGDRSHGGGIFVGSTEFGVTQTATAVIRDSTITGNSGNSTNSSGGAILTVGSSLMISNSTISGNSTVGSNSNGGGAIYSYETNVELTGVTASDNHTTAGSLAYGGAIRAVGGSLTISGSTMTNNRTIGDQSFGGAIYALRASTNIVSSTLSGNFTTGDMSFGGAISSRGGTLDITNSTISGNRTEGGGANGGGIEADGAAVVVIENSTIVENTNIATGGGILANGSLTISNSVIAKNVANFAEADINASANSSSFVATFSLIGVNDGTGLAASSTSDPTTGNLVGTSSNPLDPLLESLADNGGPTMTHVPMEGSLIIDAGDPSFDAGSLANDQRGFARVVDGDDDNTATLDLGAVEAATDTPNTAPTISAIVDQSLNINTASDAIPFTIQDSESPASDLSISKLSSNIELIPNENIVISGEDGNRTVIVTPLADQTGTATITVTVSDPEGLMMSELFEISVTADTSAPTITAIDDQTAVTNASVGPLAFTIGDNETAAEDLVVTGTSSNTQLVPALATNIVVDGVGANRTLTLIPRTNQSGMSTIVVTVTDSGGAMTSVEFELTIEDPVAIDPIVTISPTGPGGIGDPANLPSGMQPTSWANQRSSLREIVIDLGAAIPSAFASDLALTNLGLDPANDTATPITMRDDQISLSGDGLQVTITLDAGQLSDGLYQLDLLTGITGGDTFTITGDQTNGLFVLAGDWNGSGGVNIQDFATFAYWFGLPTSTAPEYVDLNNSGGVNIQDFAGFAANFGRSILFPTSGVQSDGAGEGEVEPEATLSMSTANVSGDINGDGRISSDDALEVFAEIGRGETSGIGWTKYDSNQDSNVNAADALFVINRLGAEDLIAPMVEDDDAIERDIATDLNPLF